MRSGVAYERKWNPDVFELSILMCLACSWEWPLTIALQVVKQEILWVKLWKF